MPRTRATSPSPKEYKSSFLNDTGVELIKNYGAARTYVGFDRYAAYRTELGEWLIGYGSKKLFKKNINWYTRGTVKEIEEQLVEDLESFAPLVEHYVTVPLNPKKKGALLSYAHSIGMGAFKDCKLLELINSCASKNKIIREWSPYINRKDYYPEQLRERRRVELNTYLAPDATVPLFIKHKCELKQCLLNIGETYMGTPNQVKAIEYLERKIVEWDENGEGMRRFFRLWNQEQGGLGSPKSL